MLQRENAQDEKDGMVGRRRGVRERKEEERESASERVREGINREIEREKGERRVVDERTTEGRYARKRERK